MRPPINITKYMGQLELNRSDNYEDIGPELSMVRTRSHTFTLRAIDESESLFRLLGLDPSKPPLYDVLITAETKVPAPPKPVKGQYPWGVGRQYRRARRTYAKQFRKWKRSKTVVTHTLVRNVRLEIESA